MDLVSGRLRKKQPTGKTEDLKPRCASFGPTLIAETARLEAINYKPHWCHYSKTTKDLNCM